jgi:hypothetical protein
LKYYQGIGKQGRYVRFVPWEKKETKLINPSYWSGCPFLP